MILRGIGCVYAHGEGPDDGITLENAKLQPGDFLDVAVHERRTNTN